MREFGVPALTEIPASARLTDMVFRRAEAEPGVVVLRRRTGAGDWQDVTAAEFRAEVTALARRPDGRGHRAGRPGRAHVAHPL